MIDRINLKVRKNNFRHVSSDMFCAPQFENLNSEWKTSFIQAAISRASAAYGVSEFDLRVRTLLHLPRFDQELLERNDDLILNEVDRHCLDLLTNLYTNPFNGVMRESKPNDYIIDIATNEEIELFIGKLHYLRTIRTNSIHIALRHRKLGFPVGVIAISDFDLAHLQITPSQYKNLRVVSRIYTTNEVPYNTNSFFLGAVVKWIRRNIPEVVGLFTYLNRNLGFTGTLYKATNWQLVARERNVRYSYLQGSYVTDRFLKDKFKTAEENELRNFGVSFSKTILMPLEIYYLRLNGLSLNKGVQNISLWRD